MTDRLIDDYKTERSFISCLMGAAGVSCLSGGSIWDALILWSFIPALWANEIADYMREPIEPSVDFKRRVEKLAKKVTLLPKPDLDDYSADNYQDLADPDTREKLYRYLDNVLPGSGFIAAVEALAEADPRILLKVSDEDNTLDMERGKIIVEVYTKDAAWIDSPTLNTIITGIDGFTDFSSEEESSDDLGEIVCV